MRAINFAPGPARIPDDVLRRVRNAILEFQDSRVGILELFHRSNQFRDLLDETSHNLAQWLDLNEHEILFLPGGARLQFGALPLNILSESDHADYVVTGHFAKEAYEEATRLRKTNVVWSGEATDYREVPSSSAITRTPGSKYLHLTSNNTDVGTAISEFPVTGPQDGWLAVDASSDLLTRRLPLSDIGVAYATSHKNLGTAGLCIVLIRRDVLANISRNPPLPLAMSYAHVSHHSSQYSTPPVFQLFVLRELVRWLSAQGSQEEVELETMRKSELIYSAISESPHFSLLANPLSRSHVNVCFSAIDERTNEAFISYASSLGLSGLAGYRKTGGLRASLYNATPIDAASRLANVIRTFRPTAT
jgi:phosphoserine aminotransferase